MPPRAPRATDPARRAVAQPLAQAPARFARSPRACLAQTGWRSGLPPEGAGDPRPQLTEGRGAWAGWGTCGQGPRRTERAPRGAQGAPVRNS
eukprot:15473214-Alexandrium_andersonii.AAC.1